MSLVKKYLLEQADKCHYRYKNPVVAIDAIMGNRRSEVLEKIAGNIDGMSNSEALLHLISIRDNQQAPNSNTSMSLVLTMTENLWFEGIVDRISREPIGWIEVGSSGFDGERFLNLPAYRRMLSVNHDVEYIARLPGESDDSWLDRRQAWLSQYHPQVKVIHKNKRFDNGKEYELSLGTVESFIQQRHLIEANLCGLRGFDMGNGVRYEMLEAFDMVAGNGTIGRVRQVAGEQQPVGVMKLRDYSLEVVA